MYMLGTGALIGAASVVAVWILYNAWQPYRNRAHPRPDVEEYIRLARQLRACRLEISLGDSSSAYVDEMGSLHVSGPVTLEQIPRLGVFVANCYER